jgi:hypothetical protein
MPGKKIEPTIFINSPDFLENQKGALVVYHSCFTGHGIFLQPLKAFPGLGNREHKWDLHKKEGRQPNCLG